MVGVYFVPFFIKLLGILLQNCHVYNYFIATLPLGKYPIFVVYTHTLKVNHYGHDNFEMTRSFTLCSAL